jgi:hypothetical protein
MSETIDDKTKLQALIDDVESQINELRIKSAEVEAEAKAEINEQMRELMERKEELQNRLENLSEEQMDTSAWEDLKASVEESLNNFKDAVNRALGRS